MPDKVRIALDAMGRPRPQCCRRWRRRGAFASPESTFVFRQFEADRAARRRTAALGGGRIVHTDVAIKMEDSQPGAAAAGSPRCGWRSTR